MRKSAATRTLMGKERGGAKLIHWLDELTMIRAVRSVRNCRRCCNGTSHTTLWGQKTIKVLAAAYRVRV